MQSLWWGTSESEGCLNLGITEVSGDIEGSDLNPARGSSRSVEAKTTASLVSHHPLYSPITSRTVYDSLRTAFLAKIRRPTRLISLSSRPRAVKLNVASRCFLRSRVTPKSPYPETSRLLPSSHLVIVSRFRCDTHRHNISPMFVLIPFSGHLSL